MMSNSLSAPRHRGYLRPSSETAIKVRVLLARWGETVVGRAMGLDPHTVIRCAAGVTMQGLALNVIEECVEMDESEFAAVERAVKARPPASAAR